MLIHPTVERLRSIGLFAMADGLVELQDNPQATELLHADWLGLLVDLEVTYRANRRLSRRLRLAKLRQTAVVENVDYRSSRGLDRGLFQTLTTSQWIRDHHLLYQADHEHREPQSALGNYLVLLECFIELRRNLPVLNDRPCNQVRKQRHE